MKNWARRKLINVLAKRLFNSITEEDILRVHNGQMFFRGAPLKEDVQDAIRGQSDRFARGILWKYIKRDLQYLANVRMFRVSTNEYDMLAGKLMLRTIQQSKPAMLLQNDVATH